MKNISRKPIFILGSERSGTTLLRLILNAHSQIGIPPQTKFSRKILKRLLFFGNLTRENNRSKLVEWLMKKQKNTKLIDLKLDSFDLKKILIHQQTVGGFLSSIFQLYAIKNEKKRWGDKRPYYIQFIPTLFKLYPDALIIHLIRDGRDCVASLKRMKWWKKSAIYSMLNWRYAIRTGNKSVGIFPNQFLEVRYEDLINESEKVIKTICEFIGEDFEEKMLEFYAHSSQYVPAYKMEWHYKTTQPISNQYIGQWKNNLTKKEVQLISWCCKDELIKWNYTDSILEGISITQKIYYLIQWFIFYLEIILNKMIINFNQIFYPYSLSYMDKPINK